MIDVSIIIINYNTKDLTLQCIESIYEQTKDISFEIIISDNGSVDNSVETIKNTYRDVIIIENEDNLGFGKANNVAMDVAKGKYLFLLNSDTILKNNAVKIYFDYWEGHGEDIGALGAYLIDGKNNYIHSFSGYPSLSSMYKTLFRFFVSSLFGRFKKRNNNSIKRPQSNKIVDGYITGADLFIRNNGVRFDERFFMYFEESDLQLNEYKKKNKSVILLHEPKIIHLEGKSDETNTVNYYSFKKKSAFYYWSSCIIYMKKNHGNSFLITVLKMLVILIWILPNNIRYTHQYLRGMICN